MPIYTVSLDSIHWVGSAKPHKAVREALRTLFMARGGGSFIFKVSGSHKGDHVQTTRVRVSAAQMRDLMWDLERELSSQA